MAAYGTGTEAVHLGWEIGRDKGKDIQREAVYGGECVPPFTNSCQRGRGVTIKLGDLVHGDATKEVSRYNTT